MPYDLFLEQQNDLRERDDLVAEQSFTNNSQTFSTMYWTDRHPTTYTSVDDYTIILDAFSSALTGDSYITAAKTQCSGKVYPTFTLTNSFAPDLNPAQFSYFLNRAKVRAFAELKQVPNQEAASETRNQKIRHQRIKRIVPDRTEFEKLPKYGRR
jgi:hypothetical protein